MTLNFHESVGGTLRADTPSGTVVDLRLPHETYLVTKDGRTMRFRSMEEVLRELES